MHLDVAQRDRLTNELIAHLRVAAPGSEALLRGSLADGRADPYSDIDLLWDVPDAEFAVALSTLSGILSGVRPVTSVRVDPDTSWRGCE